MQDNENVSIPPQVDLAWRPHSLFAPVDPWYRQPWRVALLAGLLVVHGLALWGVARLDRNDHALQEMDSALLITFVAPPEKKKSPAEPMALTAERPQTLSVAREQRARLTSAKASVATPDNAPIPSLRAVLYGPEGHLQLPQATLDALKLQDNDARQFSFQVPGLDKADHLMAHRSPLSYEPTRFADAYRPTQDLLTDLLSRAVEATTPEVRMSVPGNPRAHVVCRISLLALGGSCGIDVNGEGYLPPGDDPNTLSPEEDRECQAWWDKIVDSKTQAVWRKTRELYDRQCRKPLERKPPEPPVPGERINTKP